MEKQFKVGQVWRTRSGGEATIKSINPERGVFLVDTDIDCHKIDGSAGICGAKDDNDLIELITDVPVAPEADAAPVAPEAPKFAVGQVWKLRDGRQQTISKVEDGGPYPIGTAEGFSFCADGHYYESNGRRPCHLDLVELIQDVAPAAPTFAVGQVWVRRDGHTVRIEQVERPGYPSELVTLGEDRHWRRRSGRISDVNESPYDLVQQLPFDEPSAPAIADAMIADAAALAPQHNADADEDDTVRFDLSVHLRDAQQNKVFGATEEERVLFDALVIRSVDNSDIGNTVKNLHHIQAIIAARRAL